MSEAPRVEPLPVPPWFVARPALFSLLDGALDHRVTAVVAARGYGKSTAMSAWGLANGAAWYTCGPGDDGASVLAPGVVDALRRRLPALGTDLADAVAASGNNDDPGRPELLAGLIGAALERIVPLPLVLDAAEWLGREG
ncbi:MAG: hypothetical protein ACRDJM_08825, partial [Actinomycetota bacterium]